MLHDLLKFLYIEYSKNNEPVKTPFVISSSLPYRYLVYKPLYGFNTYSVFDCKKGTCCHCSKDDMWTAHIMGFMVTETLCWPVNDLVSDILDFHIVYDI